MPIQTGFPDVVNEALDQTALYCKFTVRDQDLLKVAKGMLEAMFSDIRRTTDFLVGKTDAEAFFVKCDEENNTFDDAFQGNLILDIGLALKTPGKFEKARVTIGLPNFGGEYIKVESR